MRVLSRSSDTETVTDIERLHALTVIWRGRLRNRATGPRRTGGRERRDPPGPLRIHLDFLSVGPRETVRDGKRAGSKENAAAERSDDAGPLCFARELCRFWAKDGSRGSWPSVRSDGGRDILVETSLDISVHC
jgi:hypothetical protein